MLGLACLPSFVFWAEQPIRDLNSHKPSSSELAHISNSIPPFPRPAEAFLGGGFEGKPLRTGSEPAFLRSQARHISNEAETEAHVLRRPPSAAEAGSHSLDSGEARPALLPSGADSDAPAEGLARDERVTWLPTSPRRSFYYRCQCHLSHYHLLSLPSPSYQIIIITIISVPSTRSLSVLHITISNPHHHHHYYTPLSSAPHYHHSSSLSQVRSACPPPPP